MKTLDQVTVISDRDRRLLNEVKRIIHESLPTADVLLYGSVARGAHDTESDYDILVLTDSPLRRRDQNEIRSAVFDWELEQGVVISMLFRSKGEWNSPLARVSPFHGEVEKDAVAL